MPETENLAAFARRLGLNRSTITRAAQAGRLAMTADGQVLVAASLARWQATRGPRGDMAALHAAARAGRAAPGALVTAPPAPAAVAEVGPAEAQRAAQGPEGAGILRAEAEAARLRWHSAMLELSLALTRGTRIPRAALMREAQGLGNALRAAVERLIDQTAPRLAAAAGNAPEQRRLLVAELATARAQLLGEFGRGIRRLRPDGGVSTLGSAALAAAAAQAEVESA